MAASEAFGNEALLKGWHQHVDSTSNSVPVIQSVDRALNILESLANLGRTASVSTIAQETHLPSPTVYRILQTLVARGFVIRFARGEYSIGTAFFHLVADAGRSMGLVAKQDLDRLATTTGESVSLAMYDNESAIYVGYSTSSRSMRQFTSIGNRVPLHSTGVGKVLLAQLDSPESSRVLQHLELTPFTDQTITSFDELTQEIAAIRKNRYAVDNEEQEMGVRCLAVPISGHKLFALSVSGPPSRMTDEFIHSTVLDAITETAMDLSSVLSGASDI